MKLYGYFRSSAAYRVRIALNLKGLAYQAVAKRLRDGEHRLPDYLAINPQGLVPALEHEGQVLTQSLAIIEYLDECFPEPPLLPQAAAERARVRSLAQQIACDIHPLNNLRVLAYLRQALSADQQTLDAWYAHWIAQGFTGLEAQARQSSPDGCHLFGSSVTLADVCLVPQVYNARRYRCDLAPFPTLCSIAAHLETLPAFAAAAPQVQPDAE